MKIQAGEKKEIARYSPANILVVGIKPVRPVFGDLFIIIQLLEGMRTHLSPAE